ncbi:ABC-2 family transporter protein [Streptomyces sp. KM77-8]|uniref:ABC-2 family transporter protein n=1 Tax=Streptomyces haneummycinicus TaxID=3074435 RepID=A0AAT9HLW3_9ACTN
MSLTDRSAPAPQPADRPDPASWPLPRAHRLMTLVPRTEWAYRPRIAATAFVIVTQVFLYVLLWRALYGGSGETVVGLDMSQAITYSVLATLMGTGRVIMEGASQETAQSKIRDGSVVFWFVRPLSARRYCAWRGLGESLYATAWLLVGLAVGVACGLVALPPSPAAAAVTVLAYGLGQIVFYQIGLLVDLTSFWTITSFGVNRLAAFAQLLLSGGLIPLWFFPDWLRAVAVHLPFAATINVPVSLYTGRIPAAECWPYVAEQALWCVVLALLSRVMWQRAARRLLVLGG